MKKKTSYLDLSKLKTVSLRKRHSKVKIGEFAKAAGKGKSFVNFIESLPHVLAVKDFRNIVTAIKKAKSKKRLILFMLGAHVVKCGLNPLLIDLMKNGFVGGIALNGAGAIHDFELAFCGQTSEEVDTAVRDGSFGMSRETAEFINGATKKAALDDAGLGKTLGKIILEKKLPFKNLSLQANAAKYRIPLTVHVAIGTDIIHPHPSCNGENLGKAAMNDFRLFIELVSRLEGGVVLNIGSAVIMPEVFLKAISTARNLGYKVNNFTAVCLDMIKHYRPLQNVVKRPTAKGGQGYYLLGHHEIMVPLLYRALIEGL